MSHYPLRLSRDGGGSDNLSTSYPPIICGAHYPKPRAYENDIEKQTDMLLNELERELEMSCGEPSSATASTSYSPYGEHSRIIPANNLVTLMNHSGNTLFVPHGIRTSKITPYSYIDEEERDSTDLRVWGPSSHSSVKIEEADPLDLHVGGVASYLSIEKESFSLKRKSRSGESVRVTAQSGAARSRPFPHTPPEIDGLLGRNTSLEPRVLREEHSISRRATSIECCDHDVASRLDSKRLCRLRRELERTRSELEDAEMTQAQADAKLHVALGRLKKADTLIQYLSSVVGNEDDSVSQSYSRIKSALTTYGSLARPTPSNDVSSSFQDVGGSNSPLTPNPYVSTPDPYASSPNPYYSSTPNRYIPWGGTSPTFTSAPNPYTLTPYIRWGGTSPTYASAPNPYDSSTPNRYIPWGGTSPTFASAPNPYDTSPTHT